MRVQLQSLDLHHLTVLHLSLRECRVTRVAAKVGQLQPTVSGILRRLGRGLDDQILVRSGAQMVPTERALAMRQSMTKIVVQIARLEVESRFDPTTSDREFVIASTLLPQVVSKVIASGPRLRVKLRMIDSGFDVTRALENGEIDLVIGGPNPGPQLNICTTRRSGA